MQYYVIKMDGTKFGYAIKGIDEDGTEYVEKCLNRKTPDNCLYLPDPVVKDTNRHFIALSLLAKQSGDFELTPKEYKAPRVLGNPASKKPLEEFLEGAEREMYLELKAKAEKARDEACRPKTEVEKLREEIEKQKAIIAQLMAQGK